MSADILRRAASLMRERAEAATSGPWEFRPRRGTESMFDNPATIGFVDAAGYFVMLREGTWTTENDMGYIASWHPAVALAVADMLDEAALTVEVMGPWDWDYPEGPMDATGSLRPEVRRALAVAQAYLGEAA